MTPDFSKLLSPSSITHYAVYRILLKCAVLISFFKPAVLYSQMDELHCNRIFSSPNLFLQVLRPKDFSTTLAKLDWGTNISFHISVSIRPCHQNLQSLY